MASDPTDGYKIASIRAVQTFLGGSPASSNPLSAFNRIQWPASIESGVRFRSKRAGAPIARLRSTLGGALSGGADPHHPASGRAGKTAVFKSRLPLERLNKEIKRRTDVVGSNAFHVQVPNEPAIERLVGAVLLENNEE